MKVNIIGAGLAGCEAALFLANRKINVRLYEMRPSVQTEVHKTDMFAELVCSNSFRSKERLSAIGLLKHELEMLDSKIYKVALDNEISAGNSLNVDRNKFSLDITNLVKNNEYIEVVNEEFTTINENEITIIASGPLCSLKLQNELKRLVGDLELNFYDALAPIISYDSINMDICYFKSRYDKGEPNYINCPMDIDSYTNFYKYLTISESFAPKDFEKNVFEGCMPVEAMAKRGFKTLLYGPFKPVGLNREGEKHFAVVQLRPDDNFKTMYNIVGFQTSLLHKHQKQLINLIPGLENAKILRFGQIHKNFYLNSPNIIKPGQNFKNYENIFIAGQISGVEGYLESCASGLYCAISVYNYIKNNEILQLPYDTMIGAMGRYLTLKNSKFLPMNANFGLFGDYDMPKGLKKEFFVNRSINSIIEFKNKHKWI